MPDQPIRRRIICTATTQQGNPCRAWAMPGTDPPRCASHGGVPGRPGAPLGNRNAVTHGLYARNWNRHRTFVDEELTNLLTLTLPKAKVAEMEDQELHLILALVIRLMLDKFIALADLIDRQAEELPLSVTMHLLSIHMQMAARLGRLLRDQRVISPEEDGISDALEEAMTELSEILGTDLTSHRPVHKKKGQFLEDGSFVVFPDDDDH